MSEKKKSQKRKAIEEKILERAHQYVPATAEEPDAPEPAPETNEEPPAIDPETGEVIPPKKKRKPRHDKSLKPPKDKNAPKPEPPAPAKKLSKKKKRLKQKKKQQQLLNAISQEVLDENEKKRASEALYYLKRWNQDKTNWKFEKLKQIWLINHALKASLVDEDNFEVLLSYIGSIQGRARETIQNDMLNVMGVHERKFGGDDAENQPTEEDETKYIRAKQIVQMLADE